MVSELPDVMPWQLLGHEATRDELRRNRARTVLLAGPEGVGRRQLARWYAAWLNCLEQGDEPCGNCASCRLWTAGHPDYREVRPQELTSQGRLNRRPEIRIGQLVSRDGDSDEPLAGWLELRPRFRHRVGVIDGAHLLTVAAANSFLKMLEEPPAWSTIVLIAPDRLALLPTIASRAVPFRLGTVPALEGPEGHPALELGTPGPLATAAADPEAYEAARQLTDAYVAALDGPLSEALQAAAGLEKAWLEADGQDIPGLLRHALRTARPARRAAADDHLMKAAERLGAYVSAPLALQVLTLRLRALA